MAGLVVSIKGNGDKKQGKKTRFVHQKEPPESIKP